MSELRQDILTGEWVVFAENRNERPHDFVRKTSPKPSSALDCSFCPGKESETPSPIYQNGKDGNWSIRVFPNMYPAVDYEGEGIVKDGFYRCGKGSGIHEVLVDTPLHTQKIHEFTAGHIAEILKVLKMRYDCIKNGEGIRYVQIFKNTGPEAGASIMHSHWQIMGIPVVPRTQQLSYFVAKKYLEESGGCIYCDILKHELKEEKRIISISEKFVVFAPYASKISFEFWIIPKEHISSLSDFNDGLISDLSLVLKEMLAKTSKITGETCYNICFQDMPLGGEGREHSHWYVRIVPRLGSFAGFEFATGSYINHIYPEKAAEFYRSF